MQHRNDHDGAIRRAKRQPSGGPEQTPNDSFVAPAAMGKEQQCVAQARDHGKRRPLLRRRTQQCRSLRSPSARPFAANELASAFSDTAFHSD